MKTLHLIRRQSQVHRAARWAWHSIRPLRVPLAATAELFAWRLRGRPVPAPPSVKQRVVRATGRTFALDTLVETGTYLGEMVEAQRRHFRRVISVELSHELFLRARTLFENADNVELLEGDSAEMLVPIVASLASPALFWLDGHWSGGNTARAALDTPILRELDVVLGSPLDHCILIDDARAFGNGDYPRIDEIRALVSAVRPTWEFTVRDDIIRIHP